MNEQIISYYMQPRYQYQENNKFIDTERFSPVANGIDLPDSRDPFHIPVDQWPDKKNEESFLEDKIIDIAWWNKQRDRCINGYTVKNAREDGSDVKITGRHYFYLNFWKIYAKTKGGKVKKLTYPRFTDLDYEEFWIIESMFQMGKDSERLKARQKGFTMKISGGVLGYNFTFVVDSQNIIIAGNDADADNAMKYTVNGLDNLINTQFYKERKKNAEDEISALRYGSKIVKLTAGSSGMQSVSRYTPYFVFYEEVGKWAKGLVRATKEFVDASLYSETVKTGFSLFVGTGGDMGSGAADLEEMYLNPDEYNLLAFPDINEPDGMCSDKTVAGFVPSWKYTVIDKDGNSLKKESIAYHEEKAKLKKKSQQILYWVNHPQYASQAFMVPSGGYFGEDVQGACLTRRSEILLKRELRIVEYGNLYWIDNKDWSKGVNFVPGPDKEGKTMFAITERPKVDPVTKKAYENLYKQTTDSYDKDESNTSKSLGSTVVGHGYLDSNSPSNYVVARATVRPETYSGGAKKFFEEVLKLNIWYNAVNLIEYSNIRIFDFYKDNGFSYLLKERPTLMISRWIQNSQVNNQYGIDPNTKPYWLSELNDLLLENDFDFIKKLFDVDILTALAKYRYIPGKKYNCDITITMALLAVLFEDEAELEVKKYQETERYSLPKFRYVRSGNSFKVA